MRLGLAMWLHSACWQELNHLNTPSQLFIASQTFPNESLTVILLLSPFCRSRNWGSGITNSFSQCPTFIQRSYGKCVEESKVTGMRRGGSPSYKNTMGFLFLHHLWRYASYPLCMSFRALFSFRSKYGWPAHISKCQIEAKNLLICLARVLPLGS